jgi:hypothetical protein
MHYADRGIIPRSISTIFSEMSRRADSQFTVSDWQQEAVGGHGRGGTTKQLQMRACTQAERMPQGFSKRHVPGMPLCRYEQNCATGA